MKRPLLSAFMAFALPLVLIACLTACGSNNGANETIAATPLTNTCVNGPAAGCDPNIYNHPGFMPYPGGYIPGFNGPMNYYPNYYGYGYPNNTYSFCNCPAGTRPVYHNAAGLGCVMEQLITPVAGFLGYYSLNAVNQQWMNIPQISNIPTQSNACTSSLAQACSVNASTCASGLTCKAAYNGSQLGFCVQQ